MKTYVICISEDFIRDAQLFDTLGISEEEIDEIDKNNCENEDRWRDICINPFVDIVKAKSREEACQIAAENDGLDVRALYAAAEI